MSRHLAENIQPEAHDITARVTTPWGAVTISSFFTRNRFDSPDHFIEHAVSSFKQSLEAAIKGESE